MPVQQLMSCIGLMRQKGHSPQLFGGIMILNDFHTLQTAHMQHTELYKYARMYVDQVQILL